MLLEVPEEKYHFWSRCRLYSQQLMQNWKSSTGNIVNYITKVAIIKIVR